MTKPTPAQSPRPDVVLGKAALNAAERLALRGKALADVLGLSEATISRLRTSISIDPKTKSGELALLLVRLYRSLDALMGGNDEQSRAWLRAANAHLGAVPMDRIRSVEGLVDVVQYLDAMRGRL
jgi:hypothetical protein